MTSGLLHKGGKLWHRSGNLLYGEDECCPECGGTGGTPAEVCPNCIANECPTALLMRVENLVWEIPPLGNTYTLEYANLVWDQYLPSGTCGYRINETASDWRALINGATAPISRFVPFGSFIRCVVEAGPPIGVIFDVFFISTIGDGVNPSAAASVRSEVDPVYEGENCVRLGFYDVNPNVTFNWGSAILLNLPTVEIVS